jgi:hypothetical protein
VKGETVEARKGIREKIGRASFLVSRRPPG